MPELTVKLGFTASDRAANYFPCMDGYRPGARQTLLTIGPLTVPGEQPTDAEQVAHDCFAAMNAPEDLPVSTRVAALRTAITDAVAALADSADPALNGVHSLSVGDTVSVGDVTLSCQRVGWAVVQ